ncbi:response regulator [Massilia yuzhufengensis]|uniref:CheY chemotaxis protein or a CheY-like REC (Receiver) domain n=1 Tax=Massilia yuzhufengensis TaxID=1164594 RepID=A0A1I1EPD3_9BURK|nr:response regulator [Massilia yuzhufengensis]SFB88877.1 CheY chemotaxis protein or a CheY-like REC (receiver) domain [Massilia yuzhufengensis]
MHSAESFKVLLVEPSNLLRRTVSLTVRGLGTAEITEAATYQTAQQVCERRGFDGVVVAVEWPQPVNESRGLTLIQQIRMGQSASAAAIPIAVLVESCNAELLGVLRSCGVSRILIKPFRVRDVIDTIDSMRELAGVATAR